MKYEILSSPMKIGSCEIKNRIVMSPMMLGFGQIDGRPTEKMMNYYEERAKGGTGLIISEITRVNDETGASSFGQLAVSHDYHIKPLAEMAERIQRHGAKFFVQLHHPGRQNVGLMINTVPLSIKMQKLTKGAYGDILFKMTPKVGPVLTEKKIVPASAAPSKCSPAYLSGGRVRALRHSEIKTLEKQFVEGAVRVKKAGCDGVELHSAHGYLIQQFLSPATNMRTDEYGGTLENRMRFLLNIIHGIKKECGKDFPLIVRLTVDECYEKIGEQKGYTLEEGVKTAKILEKNGVDAIDVSSAGYDTINYWLEPVSFEPGWRKYMAKAVKDAVSIPVLAANLIRSPEQAEEQLREGDQDFVSLGRPHIADPHWANKALSGKGTIRRCICCLHCFESMEKNAYSGTHGECSVNPFIGHEKEILKADGKGRKIVVIGGGPAGLTAAEILGRRGFDVTLYEKNDKLGGQINLAAAPPFKGKTAWFIEDAVNACKESGVKLVTGSALTAEQIKNINPYRVIVATGSSPIKPKFNGKYDDDMVCTFEDILTSAKKLKNKNVAVIGSGLTGLETAHKLVENGCSVTVIEMADEIAPGTWMQHKDDILPHLKRANTVFNTGEKLCEIGNGFIVTESTKKHIKHRIDVDNVVLALGSRPDNKLAEELEKAGCSPIVIGDSNRIGKIADATKAAYREALKIE